MGRVDGHFVHGLDVELCHSGSGARFEGVDTAKDGRRSLLICRPDWMDEAGSYPAAVVEAFPSDFRRSILSNATNAWPPSHRPWVEQVPPFNHGCARETPDPGRPAAKSFFK